MQNLAKELQDAEHVEFAQPASYSLLNRQVFYGWQKSQVEKTLFNLELNRTALALHEVLHVEEGTCSCVAYNQVV